MVNNWYQPLFNNSSANKMQQIKQVEVRMDESHLEAKVDAPESTCSMVCDKIMKNMVLTLTILGKYSGHCHGAFTYSPPVICLLILVSAPWGWGGGGTQSQHAFKKGKRDYCSWSSNRRVDKHTCGWVTLTACFFGNGKREQQEPQGETPPCCEEEHTNVTAHANTKSSRWETNGMVTKVFPWML